MMTKEEQKSTEALDYRRERLEEFGFSKYQVKKLADMKIEISEIREKLIKKGCTPDLAWRILREV